MQLELGKAAAEGLAAERERADGYMAQLLEQQGGVKKLLASHKETHAALSKSTALNKVRPDCVPHAYQACPVPLETPPPLLPLLPAHAGGALSVTPWAAHAAGAKQRGVDVIDAESARCRS